jgi:hypothetical protein
MQLYKKAKLLGIDLNPDENFDANPNPYPKYVVANERKRTIGLSSHYMGGAGYVRP